MFTQYDTPWQIKVVEDNEEYKFFIGRRYQGDRVYLHSDKKIRNQTIPHETGFFDTAKEALEHLDSFLEKTRQKDKGICGNYFANIERQYKDLSNITVFMVARELDQIMENK